MTIDPESVKVGDPVWYFPRWGGKPYAASILSAPRLIGPEVWVARIRTGEDYAREVRDRREVPCAALAAMVPRLVPTSGPVFP